MKTEKRILHIINQSPFQAFCLKACLNLARANDAILFYGDGVYAVLDESLSQNEFENYYVLEDDFYARGLNQDQLPKTMKLITMDTFVQLCCDYDLSQSWY